MTKSEYEIDYFETEGLIRQQCKHCQRFFWARVEREDCGESPCIEYSFIGNPPTRGSFGLHETREMFLSFLERNGHTRIARYPITARWRDDVFFTQASIYGFQPWVISGVVEPPANPLAISQTCVRFNDIENVGRTGSHMTMFEMMAHHAFNKEGKHIYFKNRTVELCDEFFMGEFGIKQDRLAYIEAEWKGGGNSGPCFEIMVDGVELATLVFMMYDETGGAKTPLDMQVVDTGYGLERMSWISQGTSSAYEAVFGAPLENLKNLAGVKGDSEILAEYSRVAGLLNIDNPGTLRELKNEVAARLGITVGQLEEETAPLENIYVICDHSRALMFLLNDGIVPSNVKAGYFARMLVRRAMRSMDILGLEIRLSDIVGSQIDYFQGHFQELKVNRDDILELVDVEDAKYRGTLRKGKSLVARLEDRLESEGKVLSVEDLVELYDSHGLSPEVVAEITSREFEIPDTFYQMVAQRHEKTGIDEVRREEVRHYDVAPTHIGFYEDAHVAEFEASILLIEGADVVLDITYFYAEGGGQEADHGGLAGFRVLDVQKYGQVIVHTLETADHGLKTGQKVKCFINWPRRRQLMRHHTATHLMNAAAREVLGNHVWQSGAHKSEDLARLDITHYAGLTPEQFQEIEEKANEYVIRDIPVNSYVMDRVEAEKKYGIRLYQGGAVPGKNLRIIDVEGVDVEACGGIHCTRTTEVGPIKLLRSKRIQDGVLRLEFIAGKPLIEWMKQHHTTILAMSEMLKVSHEKLPDTVEMIYREWREFSKEMKRDRKKGATDLKEQALANAETVGESRLLQYEVPGNAAQMIEVSKQLSGEKNLFAVLSSSENFSKILLTSTSRDINAGLVAKELASEFNLGGGGRPDFAQIGTRDADHTQLVKMRNRAVEMAKEMLAN